MGNALGNVRPPPADSRELEDCLKYNQTLTKQLQMLQQQQQNNRQSINSDTIINGYKSQAKSSSLTSPTSQAYLINAYAANVNKGTMTLENAVTRMSRLPAFRQTSPSNIKQMLNIRYNTWKKQNHNIAHSEPQYPVLNANSNSNSSQVRGRPQKQPNITTHRLEDNNLIEGDDNRRSTRLLNNAQVNAKMEEYEHEIEAEEQKERESETNAARNRNITYDEWKATGNIQQSNNSRIKYPVINKPTLGQTLSNGLKSKADGFKAFRDDKLATTAARLLKLRDNTKTGALELGNRVKTHGLVNSVRAYTSKNPEVLKGIKQRVLQRLDKRINKATEAQYKRAQQQGESALRLNLAQKAAMRGGRVLKKATGKVLIGKKRYVIYTNEHGTKHVLSKGKFVYLSTILKQNNAI